MPRRLAVRRGHMNVAAKADDVTEAEAFEEFEQFDVAETAIGQDRHRHALGQDRLQTRQRKTTMSASSVALNTVETGLGPLRASDVVARLRHLATVLRLSPSRAARALFVSKLS